MHENFERGNLNELNGVSELIYGYPSSKAKCICCDSPVTDSHPMSAGMCILVIFINSNNNILSTRVGTLIVATIYLQLIQNRYMFRSFTVLHCSHQHCVQPVASDVEVVGYL